MSTSHIATAYCDANKILFRNSVDEVKDMFWCERLDAQIQGYRAIFTGRCFFPIIIISFFKVRGTGTSCIESGGPLAAPFVAHSAAGCRNWQSVGFSSMQMGMITLYLGKITALLFYLLCVFWAVRSMPWERW
ncbi:MAG: hypothetical protein ACLVAT_10715 [Lachnospiraceae bacterium]